MFSCSGFSQRNHLKNNFHSATFKWLKILRIPKSNTKYTIQKIFTINRFHATFSFSPSENKSTVTSTSLQFYVTHASLIHDNFRLQANHFGNLHMNNLCYNSCSEFETKAKWSTYLRINTTLILQYAAYTTLRMLFELFTLILNWISLVIKNVNKTGLTS